MMLLWNSIESYKVYYIHNMDPPPKLALSIYSSFIPHGAPMEIQSILLIFVNFIFNNSS